MDALTLLKIAAQAKVASLGSTLVSGTKKGVTGAARGVAAVGNAGAAASETLGGTAAAGRGVALLGLGAGGLYAGQKVQDKKRRWDIDRAQRAQARLQGY